MAKKSKVGGCKKHIRPKKVSKGLRRSIAKPFGRAPAALGAQRQERREGSGGIARTGAERFAERVVFKRWR